MELVSVFFYFLSFLFGGLLVISFISIRDKMTDVKKSKQMNSIFSEVLSAIGNSKFVTRVNSTVTISVVTGSLGSVNLIYMLDRKDIAIFQESRCIYTSESVDPEIISSIIELIVNKHGGDIDDVVGLFGFLFSKVDFEKKFKMRIENGMLYPLDSPETSDVDKIVNNNSTRFYIDDILDKINSVGIDNLSVEEKKFLKSYKS